MLMPKINLFYDSECNWFTTIKGEVVYNMTLLVPMNQLYLFKKRRESIEFINSAVGVIVKLLYPKEENRE